MAFGLSGKKNCFSHIGTWTKDCSPKTSLVQVWSFPGECCRQNLNIIPFHVNYAICWWKRIFYMAFRFFFQQPCYTGQCGCMCNQASAVQLSMAGLDSGSVLWINPIFLHVFHVPFHLYLPLQQTYIGSILAAVNPYQSIPDLYDRPAVERYSRHHLGEISPHIYAVANECYRSLWKRLQNQCVLIRWAMIVISCCFAWRYLNALIVSHSG